MKKVSTLAGIVVIVVVALIAFGGVFGYQYFENQNLPQVQSPQQQTKGATAQLQSQNDDISKQLSDDAVISAINKLDGIQLQKDNQDGLYLATSAQGDYTYTIRSITKADLNGDGFQDAFVWGNIVSGSGGSSDFIIVINNGNSANAFDVNPDGINTAGAGQYDIKDISINNSIITISVGTTNADGSVGPNLSFSYKLVGNNLIRTN